MDVEIIKSFILVFLILTSITYAKRILFNYIYTFDQNKIKASGPTRVIIYGAGAAGVQLASSLNYLEGKYEIKGFIDDCPELWKRKIFGFTVFSFDEFLKNNVKVDQILLAMPSLSEKKYAKIISKLKHLEIRIMRVPSIKDITIGKTKIDSLLPISINDLLGREEVLPMKKMLHESISGLTVCITGAGGSIGTELCLEVINLNPKKTFFIDNSEFNLYKLETTIMPLVNKDKNIKKPEFILGDLKNINFLKHIFSKNKIDIVFHTAAYKHVPLIENNPLQGIENNVFITKNLCEVSLENNIKNFILISSDKAVRPNNVMGATKRLCEIIVKDYSKLKNNIGTCFSIVRFGNVLASSGSVVPLFEKQINSGGPITITDKNIIRYFMTIREAAQLVIQSKSLAKNGDLFLLDMGNPVKIYDLAVQMIKLRGLTIKNKLNPNGDISIIETGLRPGEKLFEELLIDGFCEKTKNPLINLAHENNIECENLEEKLKDLQTFVKQQNKTSALKSLFKLVPEWSSNI